MPNPENMQPGQMQPRVIDLQKAMEEKSGEQKIEIGVVSLEGKVVIDFNQPISQIAFSPEQAIGFAEVLVKTAKKDLEKPKKNRRLDYPY